MQVPDLFVKKKQKDTNFKKNFNEFFAFLRLVRHFVSPQDAFPIDVSNNLAKIRTFWYIPKLNIWGYTRHSICGETVWNVLSCFLLGPHNYIEDNTGHEIGTHDQIIPSNRLFYTRKKRKFLQCFLRLWFGRHEIFFDDSNKNLDPENSFDSLYKCRFWCLDELFWDVFPCFLGRKSRNEGTVDRARNGCELLIPRGPNAKIRMRQICIWEAAEVWKINISF